MPSDFRSLCATQCLERMHVSFCCLRLNLCHTSVTAQTQSFSVSYLVKTSPSKKRRAGAGPVKRAAGSGPSLMTQASSSSTAQSPLLQHQASSDTREDSEADKSEDERAQKL